MSHPTPEQDGPSERGRTDRGADTVALTKGPDARADDPSTPSGPPAQRDGRAEQRDDRPAWQDDRGGAPERAAGPSGWPPPTNAKAIIALCTALSVPVLAIVFGVMARREIDRTGEAGRAYATWGMWLGIAVTALWVLYLAGIAVFVAIGAISAATAGAAFNGGGSGF